ncbi:MAG TPA: hypothetical protein VFK37_09555 [Bacillales bacterium]|nr:hypothetical protein [Bacillales bacterium]
MFTMIAYSALLLTFIMASVAIKHPQFYWVAAGCIYVFSAMAGFSIGQLTVGLTFVFLVLALGYSFGWIKGKGQHSLAVGAGILIGGFAVLYVDDFWLFYPVSFLS